MIVMTSGTTSTSDSEATTRTVARRRRRSGGVRFRLLQGGLPLADDRARGVHVGHSRGPRAKARALQPEHRSVAASDHPEHVRVAHAAVPEEGADEPDGALPDEVAGARGLSLGGVRAVHRLLNDVRHEKLPKAHLHRGFWTVLGTSGAKACLPSRRVPEAGTLRAPMKGAEGMSESLATILTDTTARHANRLAFKLDDVELTYGMLDEASARLAGVLASKGVEPGDRV